MSQEVAASNNVTEDLTGGLLGKTGTITYGLIDDMSILILVGRPPLFSLIGT
jgi:hypothetical protein